MNINQLQQRITELQSALYSILLTQPPLAGDNPYCLDNNNLLREGLSMAGKIRSDDKCSVCGAGFFDNGTDLVCKKHFTTPKKYYLDLHYTPKGIKKKGIRLKIRWDQHGQRLDSYARAVFESRLIYREIAAGKFNPNIYCNKSYQKYVFDDFVWKWFDQTKSDLAPGSIINKELMIRVHYLPQFGGCDIREIRKFDILQYYNKLKETNLSDNFISAIMNGLKKIFKDACDWEMIDRIPGFPKIKRVRPESPKWIDRDTQEKILALIKPGHQPIFKFLILTGCRPGEARALMWDCIDFEKGIVTIRRTFSRYTLKHSTKTGKPRYLPMGEEMHRLLAEQKKTSPFVFINKYINEHYRINFGKVWKTASKKLGYDLPLKNATRHSFACQRLNDGQSVEKIAALLGHTDIRITQSVYTEFHVHHLTDAMENKKVVRLTGSSGHRPDTVRTPSGLKRGDS